MNIDGRIEALTQSVELMSQMQQSLERKHEEDIREIRALVTRVVTVQEMMAQILNGHEQRLRDIEGRR
ncbi:MAG TPA: hypothetical protein VF283_19815 [Bryobacteraceae bacterium]